MERHDDPEERIRELERPLADTARASEAGQTQPPPGGGAGDVDGVGVLVRVVDGAGPLGVPAGGPNVPEMVGGELMIDLTPESWCAAKAAMPPARARKPMTMTVPTIHHVRLAEARFGGGPANGPP